MIYQLILIVWLADGPHFYASGFLPDEKGCQRYALDVSRFYPFGTQITGQCIEGHSI